MGILAIIMALLPLIEMLIKWLSGAKTLSPVQRNHLSHLLARVEVVQAKSKVLGVEPALEGSGRPPAPTAEELASDS